ncbi:MULTISPECIES: hypothetical protein [Cupriavidus]
MMKNRCAFLLIALAAMAGTPLAFAAAPAGDPAHDHNHAPERPEAPAAAPQGNPDIDAQVAHLRAIRERLSRAGTPEERQALVAERAKVMQEIMATVHKTGAMAGPGGARASMGKNKAAAGQMSLCRDMMGQHMALMQEMMQAAADTQGTGGMGPAAGPAMGGGMMRK